MKTSILRLTVAFAICALLPVTAANAEKAVERPFHFWGQLLLVVHDGNAVAEGTGQATHMGRVTMLATGAGTIFTGSIVAANGDEIFFNYSEPNYDMHGVFVITGGTGRFEGAGGLLNSVTEILDYGWRNDHYYMLANLTGSGTIIY